ncbi:hypothetical protein P3T76_006534 [Phytophthora citrophthora]|uniref:Uncharacterized protein n=1 Tax=Phytophthora citrophthora TaxID=4793 RepID=A0AAD9GP87_9STRA|nr:hypothetical protein P3T76_006534 [Phytophthora citrophthora]
MTFSLLEMTELVAKYVADASWTDVKPCSLIRSAPGAASYHWPLSSTESWVHLGVVPIRRLNDLLDPVSHPSLSEQLHARRALLEIICQLSATPSYQWEENFESLWWPMVLRPTDFKNERYLETVNDIGSKPKFALSPAAVTLEGVEFLFQFLQMDPSELLTEEDRQLVTSLKMSTSKRERQSVEICLKLANRVMHTPILRAMVDGLREYWAKVPSGVNNGNEYPAIELKITEIWLQTNRFLNVSEDLELLAQMVTLPSSSLHTLMLKGAYVNLQSRSGLRSFQSFSRQVLAQSSPLRMLDLSQVTMDVSCVAALCSALRYPSHLQKLYIGHTLRGAHANYRLVWAWIFLVVFHPDSSCELQHLDVSGWNLHSDVLETLMPMFETAHPGRIVVMLLIGSIPQGEGCEECPLPPNERLFVRLLNGAQAWTSSGHSAAWPQQLPDTLPDDLEFEVMVRLVDWLCILIPGYGFGWVARSAVRYEVSKPSSVATNSGVRVRDCLQSLVCRELKREGCLGLLRLIGRSLTSLDAHWCDLQSGDLDTILHLCPNLSTLNVTKNATDLSSLLLAYQTGRCRIANLGLLVGNASIAPDLQALLLHPNAKCLENLQLNVESLDADSDKSERIWTEVARTLSQNSTLRRLHLELSLADADRDLCKVIELLLKSLHGQVLGYYTPRRLKVAFLSIVEATSSSTSSVSSLDHMALSNIFSFASTSTIRRQVSVRL